MDIEFSEDQTLLADSTRRFLADHAPLSYAREHYSAPSVVDDTWRGLADLGLTGMLAPEPVGGAGLGLVELALPLGEMGRTVYPGPFAASAVAATSLLADLAPNDVSAEWLPRLANGSAVATVGFTSARGAPVSVDAAGTLHGGLTHVPDGMAAELILTVTADAATVVALNATGPGVSVRPLETVDGSRKFATVAFDGARGTVLSGDSAGARDAADAIRAANDRFGVACVLDGIGAAECCLELALEYAKDREQFGKPIGSFQAVQHLCADMLRAIELGRAVGYYAAWACDAADPAERHRAATMARAFAADSFYRVAANAIQVFGGIGFTWEHDIHLYYKRLLTLQLLGGSAADHLEELASTVF